MGFEVTLWGVLVGAWASGWLLLFRLPRCWSGGVQLYPTVSVIIPARDEERNLPRLLASLREQDLSPDEIWVVNDGSTDRTADLARAGGARVLESAPLPEGWRGKAWACQQGAREARGEVLLFLDADTYLLPGGYRRMVDTFLRLGGAVSVGPHHETMRIYENLSAYFNLLMMMGVGAFSAWSKPGRAAGLFGPCLLIRAKDYGRVGGHEAVRGQVLENLYLAQLLSQAGIATHGVSGKSTLAFRMYPGGIGELMEGWKKAFASGASRTPPGLHALIVFWLSGAAAAALLPLGAILAGWPLIPWYGVIYGLFAVQVGFHLRRIGTFSPLAAVLYPVPLFFFFGLFSRSKRGKKLTWKGRDVSPDSYPTPAETPGSSSSL